MFKRMNVHFCDDLAGGRGICFEGGVVDRLLDAAEAVAAAQLATDHTIRQVHAARLALGCGGRTALAWSAAQQRYATGQAHLDDLTGQWGVPALHLARVAAMALRVVAADPAATVSGRQLGFGAFVAVTALHDDPELLPAPPGLSCTGSVAAHRHCPGSTCRVSTSLTP